MQQPEVDGRGLLRTPRPAWGHSQPTTPGHPAFRTPPVLVLLRSTAKRSRSWCAAEALALSMQPPPVAPRRRGAGHSRAPTWDALSGAQAAPFSGPDFGPELRGQKGEPQLLGFTLLPAAFGAKFRRQKKGPPTGAVGQAVMPPWRGPKRVRESSRYRGRAPAPFQGPYAPEENTHAPNLERKLV